MVTNNGTGGAVRPRSAEYPRRTLCEVIEFVSSVAKEAGSGDSVAISRIMVKLGFRHRTADRFSGLVSSARQFGLIRVDSSTITLTDEGNRLVHGPEESRAAILSEAVKKPTLYAALIDEYAGKGLPSVKELAGHLFEHKSKYRIVKTKTAGAAANFLASVEEAGLISEGGVLTAHGSAPLDEIAEDQKGEKANVAGTRSPTDVGAPQIESDVKPKTKSGTQGVQSSSVHLGDGRFATLQVPGDLKAAEAERLKQIIDLLVAALE